MLERLKAWPSTSLGVVAAAAVLAVWQGAPADCQQYLSNYQVWGGAAALAVWGALIKGGTKSNVK